MGGAVGFCEVDRCSLLGHLRILKGHCYSVKLVLVAIIPIQAVKKHGGLRDVMTEVADSCRAPGSKLNLGRQLRHSDADYAHA